MGGDPTVLLIVNLILPFLLAYPIYAVIGHPGMLIKGKSDDTAAKPEQKKQEKSKPLGVELAAEK